MESDKSNESGARKTITARAEEDCCAPTLQRRRVFAGQTLGLSASEFDRKGRT